MSDFNNRDEFDAMFALDDQGISPAARGAFPMANDDYLRLVSNDPEYMSADVRDAVTLDAYRMAYPLFTALGDEFADARAEVPAHIVADAKFLLDGLGLYVLSTVAFAEPDPTKKLELLMTLAAAAEAMDQGVLELVWRFDTETSPAQVSVRFNKIGGE